MSSIPRASLTQYADPIVIEWDDISSKIFNAKGARGFNIFIPNGWVAATLDFYGIIATQPVPQHDNEGVQLRITGISTTASGLYIAPSASWGLGALEKIQLFSRNTGDTAFVSQTIENIRIYPLR